MKSAVIDLAGHTIVQLLSWLIVMSIAQPVMSEQDRSFGLLGVSKCEITNAAALACPISRYTPKFITTGLRCILTCLFGISLRYFNACSLTRSNLRLGDTMCHGFERGMRES